MPLQSRSGTEGIAAFGMGGPNQGPHQPGTVLFVETVSSGDYTFSNVVTGTYLVIARDRGYQRTTSEDFTVSTGDNTAPTVKLTAQPTPTDTLPSA